MSKFREPKTTDEMQACALVHLDELTNMWCNTKPEKANREQAAQLIVMLNRTCKYWQMFRTNFEREFAEKAKHPQTEKLSS